MTIPTQRITIRIEGEMAAAMLALEVRDGIPKSEQTRRALRDFLIAKGTLKAPKRAAKKGR